MAKAHACIYVLGGTNGAGKSSIAGEMFRKAGADYFNPDEAAKRILAVNPTINLAKANILAWNEGKRMLKRSIAERLNFAFETTLGGRTITSLLQAALLAEIEVRIWYVGLSSPEQHIRRVRARVAEGGHDIPEAIIRQRYDNSRINLIGLLPRITELKLYDNSEEANPSSGIAPEPRLILHLVKGQVVEICDLSTVPEWAKPVVAAALKFQ